MAVITVFEQETLRVGEERDGVRFTAAHHEALARFAMGREHRFFTLGRNKVRFAQYVGVIQVGRLVLEILPKADRGRRNEAVQWRHFLFDMLSYCRLLKIERSSAAGLQLRGGALLDLYLDLFLAEVEKLLREGLARTYRRRRDELPVLKGRFLFERQIRRNPVHRERFQVEYDRYDYDHPFNRMIGAALRVLRTLPLSPATEARLNRIYRHFPDTALLLNQRMDWDALLFDRHTERYRTATLIAQLILQGYAPDVQRGRYPLVAILFDMNQLFEEYVFHQLVRAGEAGITVSRQERRPFWRRHYLQPDILLDVHGERLVLDTKWKVLRTVRPDAADLRQIYVYSRYFGARRGVLLYPAVHDLPDLPPEPYHPGPSGPEAFYCQINFLTLFRDGRLNRNLGRELIRKLG